MTRVVEGRGRVCLRQRVYEDSKQRLKTGRYSDTVGMGLEEMGGEDNGRGREGRIMGRGEMVGEGDGRGGGRGQQLTEVLLYTEYEELQELSSSNQRREDRLARVRHRDFSGRLETIRVSRRGCEAGDV